MENNAHIRFDNISKFYGDVKIIEDLDLNIKKGEFISLLGPSGSGKTTLLMMLAGFESATKGTVWLNDKALNDLPSYKRNIGVVFQNYALFPHMTVAQNIAFPLQMRGVNKAEIKQKVEKVLDMVQLAAMKERKPAQLSGGQQQRVALARALVFEPEVILMDEPLGALDKQLREQMQLDIRALHQRLGVTIVFVTHDQEEALAMSDQVVLLNQGRIEQHTSPEELYSRPASEFAAGFIGNYNMGSLHVFRQNGHHSPQAVRPETIQISLENGDIPGTIQTRTLLGSVVRYRVHTAHDDVLNVDVLNHGQLSTLSEGMAVFLSIPAAAVIALAPAH